jgi:hypothetical protein
MSLRWCLFVWIGLMPLLTAGTFEEKVLPILKSNCLPCHDERTRTSGFSITSPESIKAGGSRRGRAVKAGLPAESTLVQLLRGQRTPQMPLGKRLPDADIEVIEKWIEELKPEEAASSPGGKKYWAFVKPVRHDPPAVRNTAWVRNPIDNFILKKLEEKKLQPAREASRRVLIRRLYFD